VENFVEYSEKLGCVCCVVGNYDGFYARESLVFLEQGSDCHVKNGFTNPGVQVSTCSSCGAKHNGA
jgi:hypothetical protein